MASVMFAAAGFNDLNGDGNIEATEWQRQTLFASDERLALVIDDPRPGRQLRLLLIGGNGKQYDFPELIVVQRGTFQPLVWDEAIGAKECVNSNHILAELYDVRTGELVGVCSFSIKEQPES